MANEILTDDKIMRKALPILHDKLNFIGNVNRQYDSQFAKSGAKIGSELRVRLPNEYVVRHGRTASPQSTQEKAETLVVATQDGVDLSFYSDELTMSIDDFSARHIEPAMSVLASYLESQALQMVLDVSNAVGTPGTQPNALYYFLAARRRLGENLAPAPYTACINGACSAAMVNGLSSLYHAGQEVAHQYKEGFMLRNSGINYYENNMIPLFTAGSCTNSTPLMNGDAQEGSTISIDGLSSATATLKKGQVITIDGVYAVHPETKVAYGWLKQFTVTADTTGSGSAMATLPISPAIIASGARQNVSAAPAGEAAVTVLPTGMSASTAYPANVVFNKDAFTFVTADLELPKGTDMASRKVKDGISLRFIRDYDIKADEWISRFDVLWGCKTIREQLACRVWGKNE